MQRDHAHVISCTSWMPLVCRNKLIMAKSRQIWVRGSDVEVNIPLLQRSFSYYIICCWPRKITQGPCLWPLGDDHVLFGTLKFMANWRSSRAKRSLRRHFFFYPRNNLEVSPMSWKWKGRNAEIQFASFISLLSGKLSNNHQMISLGLNSICHFSIFFFSLLKSVSPHVRKHRLNCVISERLWI